VATSTVSHEVGRLSVGDVSVRVSRGGSGPALLFLHGAGGHPGWLPLFDRLAQHSTVIVPEHPGFGRSDDPRWIRHVSDLAMYYLDFLDAMALSGVHAVGHSLGGWTAAEVAVRNCSRLASLTLIAPAGIRVKGVPPGDNFIWSPEEAARNRFHDQAFANAVLEATPSEERLDEQMQNQLAAVKFGWEPRWFNPDLEKWLHRISVPTHVIWGDDDKILPAAYAPRWGERVKGARITIIQDAGHVPHVEKMERVAGPLLAFLAGVAA
jgi:pimeloyl-ACP methyl ester carboxylesterase